MATVTLRLIPLLGLCLSPVIVWTVYQRGMIHAPLIIAVDLILVAGLTLPLFKNDPQAPHLVAKQVLGLVYIPFSYHFWSSSGRRERGRVDLLDSSASSPPVIPGRFIQAPIWGATSSAPGSAPRKPSRAAWGAGGQHYRGPGV
jgi:hypothetical protein